MRNRIAALLFASLFALTSAACGNRKPQPQASSSAAQEAEEASSAASEAAESSETAAKSETPDTSLPQEDCGPVLTYSENKVIPDYYHYENDGFLAACEKMTAAAEKGEEEELLRLYDALYTGSLAIIDLDYAVYLEYSRDVSDEYYSEEMIYADTMETESLDTFLTACRKVTESSLAEAFHDHVGDYSFEGYQAYESVPEKVFDLQEQETRLEDEYNTIMSDLSAYYAEYKGRTVTIEDFMDGSYAEIYGDNTNIMYLTYLNLSDKLNRDIGEIFVKLVEVRNEIAAEYGYDSYVDYCYENIYGREYTREDVRDFCDGVKEKISGRFADIIFDHLDDSVYEETEASTEEYVADLARFLDGIDEEVRGVVDVMNRDNLLDMEYGESRLASSYTIDNYTNKSGYIFIDRSNTFSDFITLSHEFGHFSHAVLRPLENPLVALINYDVQEIHSTGLEYMMTAHYGEMLAADDAEAYVEYELVNGLYAVITGCLYDEFQRKVYDSEEPLDRAAINDAFEELVAEYGCENLFDRYDWAYVTHTFDSPLYYISYAVSSVSSLELWDISRTDPEGAVRMWKSVLLSDDAVQSYWEIMEEAGLTDIFEGDNAADICGVVLEALDKGTAVSRKAA